MLRDGGNAFDAAVCAVLTSFVSESPLTGLGAGGFLLAHTAGARTTCSTSSSRRAGAASIRTARAELVAVEVAVRRHAAALQHRPRVVRRAGHRRRAVGGRAALLLDAVRRARRARRSRYAREGVRVTPDAGLRVHDPGADRHATTRRRARCMRRTASSCTAGDIFRFPELADALERLADEGPDWIYGGEAAERICDWVCERGGLLSPEDLAAYRVIEREPVRPLPRPRGAHECAAVLGRHPDRVRARPARALGRAGRRWTTRTGSRCWRR